MTPQQWEKFARHVQPGCRCHVVIGNVGHFEGILLENWPYESFERWIEIAEVMGKDLEEREPDQWLRYQSFDSLEMGPCDPIVMRFWVDGHWQSLYGILALPDET